MILTSARSFKHQAGSRTQNHPDSDSRNFAWVSCISGNSSCRPAPCIELLEYNGIYGIPFFPYKKTDAEVHVHCDHIVPSTPLFRSTCTCNTWAKHYPVTLKLSNLTSLPCFHSFFQLHHDQSSTPTSYFIFFFFKAVFVCYWNLDSR